jgi:hypothetical protein
MASSSFDAPAVGLNGDESGQRRSLPGLLGEEGLSAKEKYAERMKKLRDLHMKRNEARLVKQKELPYVYNYSNYSIRPFSCRYLGPTVLISPYSLPSTGILYGTGIFCRDKPMPSVCLLFIYIGIFVAQPDRE